MLWIRLVCTVALAAGSFAGTTQFHGVDSIGMTVADLDRSIEFYTKVLPFEVVSETEVAGPDYESLQGVFGARIRMARLRLGQEHIELAEYLASRGRPYPADTRGNDRWFQHIAIVVSDMDRAYRLLRKHRVQHASTGPQRLPAWNPSAGGITAFYFRDPDGHFLELIQYPAGKGDPRWQEPAGRLFLGIDHTAIVVHDTERSLKFYRDRLGLRVAGESENYGTEQEHLNSVFGARLRITALRTGSGPGIELLEYLTPRDGRPYPPDARPNDLLHWQTRITVSSAPESARILREAGAQFITPGVVRLTQPLFGFTHQFLARDPDGHALLIAQQDQ